MNFGQLLRQLEKFWDAFNTFRCILLEEIVRMEEKFISKAVDTLASEVLIAGLL
jgi:hypothetical protein